MFHGPGFNENLIGPLPNVAHRGMVYVEIGREKARNLPKGYATMSKTEATIVGAGCLSVKKMLAAAAVRVRKSPIHHILRVSTGISGSSMDETAAQTSG